MAIVRVWIGQLRSVGANGPDTIDLVPGTFVTEHEQAGIGRREEKMIQPIGRPVNDFFLTGADVEGEHRHWYAGRQSFLHHLLFVRPLVERVDLSRRVQT
jgi:hypothetical protein